MGTRLSINITLMEHILEQALILLKREEVQTQET